VSLSGLTFQITRVTNSDINAERDHIIAELTRGGCIESVKVYQSGQGLPTETTTSPMEKLHGAPGGENDLIGPNDAQEPRSFCEALLDHYNVPCRIASAI
jgi:hypothetical protein